MANFLDRIFSIQVKLAAFLQINKDAQLENGVYMKALLKMDNHQDMED